MREKIITAIGVVIVIGFITAAVANIRHTNNKIEFKEIEIKSQEVKLQELNNEYDKVLEFNAKTKKEKQQQSEKIKQLQDEKSRLERELLSRRNNERLEQEKLAQASRKAQGVSIVSASAGCNTGNEYKDFIYYKESSCNPAAVNHIGCRGIGQACPGSKLPCGDDFACQDAWFSNYAIQRYGSWEAAYNFWLSHLWW